MRYVLEGVASEDTIQLFTTLGVPVLGVAFGDVELWIRKEGEPGYTQRAVLVGDWTERGGGNYAIDFAIADFSTEGLFRYKVISPTAAFVQYEDALQVVTTIPTFPVDIPQINLQTDTPAGISPDPVYRGSNLTISGTDLLGALQVTIGGVAVTIVSNDNDEILVTVVAGVSLGTDQNVVVTTAGGSVTALVDVVLDPADIPGSGMCLLYGFIHDPATGSPVSGIGVWGKVLDMPNIAQGVAWTDAIVSVVTDANGKFELNLPREVRVEVGINRGRYRRIFTTPDLSTANLFTEIP